MLKCDVTIHRDTDLVAAFGLELFARYAAAIRASSTTTSARWCSRRRPSASRCSSRERSRATWDHRKLAAGVY